MKRSKTRFYHLLTIVFSIALLCSVSNSSFGQEETRESQSVSISTTEDGKVKLKVVKKVGNDETTFEKTYDSYDEIPDDPDLEKYGIELNGFSFGNSRQPKFFFHNGPGMGFWDGEEFEEEMDALRERMKRFMDEDWGGRSFMFGFDDDDFMNLDSLTKRFDFRNDNGNFFFNGKQFEDLDSLRESLKDKFGNFMFDFDFGDEDDARAWVYRHGDDEEDDDVKVISRAKLSIRPATSEDKILAGTDKASPLVLRDVSFYPNPSDGRFDMSLESDSDAEVKITVLNSDGKEVMLQTANPDNGLCEFQIDLTNEKKDKYVLKVVQGRRALTKRLVLE